MRPEIKIMAITAIIICMLVFAFLPFAVQADNRHDHHTPVVIQSDTVVNRYYKQGASLALAAAQHSFNSSTFALQWSVGAATYGDTDALSIAIGKRDYCSTDR